MTTATIKLYKALIAAGVDEDNAPKVSEEVVGRDQAIHGLATKVNMILGLNVAIFAGLIILLLDKFVA